MKTLKLKGLFSLIAAIAIAAIVTSCEQESLKNMTEEVTENSDYNIEEGQSCPDCMQYSHEEPDEIIDVMIQYRGNGEPVVEKAARYGEVVVYGGDVVLTENYSNEIALRGTIISNLSLTWDNSTIPYTFGSGLSAQDQAAVLSAIEYINDQTNLCVVERTNEADYLVFKDDSTPTDPLGCFVYGIGNSGGAQTVNLGPGCSSQRVIVHEVLHKAGFYHEQTRPDRDNFITVNWNNFDNSNGTCWSCQFNISGGAQAHGPYDFASVMHYRKFAAQATIDDTQPMYTVNDPSLLPPGMTENQIGNLPNMSAGDIAAVNQLYGSTCSDDGDCATPLASEITYDDFGTVIHLYTTYSGVDHQFRYRVNGGAWVEFPFTTDFYNSINNVQANSTYEVQLQLCDDNWSDTVTIGDGDGGGDCDTPLASGITYDDFGTVIHLYTTYSGVDHQFRYRVNGGAWVEFPFTTDFYNSINNVQANSTYEVQLQLCDDNWSDTVTIGDGDGGGCSTPAPAASEITYEDFSTVIHLYAHDYYDIEHQFRYRVNGGAWVEFPVTTSHYNSISNKQSCATYEVQLKEGCSDWSVAKTISTDC